MSEWVLIIIIGWLGQSVTTQEFDNKEACVNAKTVLYNMEKRTHGGLYLAAVCVPSKVLPESENNEN